MAYARRVRFWPLVAAIVLLAVGVDVARAVTTHDDLGPLEYATTYVLLVALGASALRLSRGALRRQ